MRQLMLVIVWTYTLLVAELPVVFGLASRYSSTDKSDTERRVLGSVEVSRVHLDTPIRSAK